ncbi:hypothetical protein V6N13_033589 [Hibiscus sabdariffa]
MNIEKMEQQPSMDIEQVEQHACSDRHAKNASQKKGLMQRINCIEGVEGDHGIIKKNVKVLQTGLFRFLTSLTKRGYLERSKGNKRVGQSH